MATQSDPNFFKGVLFLDRNLKKSKRRAAKRQKTSIASRRLTKEDKKALKFSDFADIHGEWLKYFGANFAGRRLDKSVLKADYHGSLLTVWSADNPTMVGTSGIVALETRNTFQLVTVEDKFVVLPKKGTVFRFIFAEKIYTLFGEGMRTRPAWRGKKPKIKRTLPTFIRGSLIPNDMGKVVVVA